MIFFFILSVAMPSRLITLFNPSGNTETSAEIATVGSDEATRVEVVIDEDGLLTASEPKRAKTDDVIGNNSPICVLVQGR